MKKFLLMMAVMFGMAMSANAQMSLGVVGNLGTGNDFTNYGVGVKFQYGFNENWRGEVSGDYFFKKDYLTMWDINADVHYLFSLNNAGMKLYPLAGVSLVGTKAEVFGVSASDTSFGVNYGVGAEAPIADNLKVLLEVKGQTADDTRLLLSFGVAYNF